MQIKLKKKFFFQKIKKIFFKLLFMRLIRDVCIIKLLYKTFFDILNNFQDISLNAKNSSSHKGWFHPLEPFLGRIIFKYIYLPPLHVCKVSSKSEFSSSRDSLVSIMYSQVLNYELNNIHIGLGKKFLRVLPALGSHNSGNINRIWQYLCAFKR